MEREIAARTHELAEARDRAEAASTAKSAFMANLSQELRTPLNAIVGFAQLLAGTGATPLPARQRRQVERIQSSGAELLQLLESLLDLTRLDTGELELQYTDVDSDRLIEEAAADIAAAAENADVTITRAAASENAKLRIDAARTRAALGELIVNALRHSAPGDEVTIESRPTRDGLFRIGVTDCGPGIPPESRDHIFDPFSRAPLPGGGLRLGLGLAVARRLVDAMGGDIGFSTQVGVGSTFWLTLPTADHPAAAPPPDAATAREDTPDDGDPPDRHALVLYIEADAAQSALMQDIVDSIGGVTLIVAHSASLGLALARDYEPHAIVMNLDDPETNTAALPRLLRADARTRDIPLIALSMDGEINPASAATESGYLHHLGKPIDTDAMIRTLRDTLKLPS